MHESIKTETQSSQEAAEPLDLEISDAAFEYLEANIGSIHFASEETEQDRRSLERRDEALFKLVKLADAKAKTGPLKEKPQEFQWVEEARKALIKVGRVSGEKAYKNGQNAQIFSETPHSSQKLLYDDMRAQLDSETDNEGYYSPMAELGRTALLPGEK